MKLPKYISLALPALTQSYCHSTSEINWPVSNHSKTYQVNQLYKSPAYAFVWWIQTNRDYGKWRFHRPWDGTNQYSGSGFIASVRIWLSRYAQKGLMGQWSYCCIFMGQDSAIEIEMAWIGPSVAELQHPKKSGCPTRISERAWWPMTMHCTSMDQNGSIELVMEQNSQVVVELHHPKFWMDGWTDGRKEGRTERWINKDYFIVFLTFLWKGKGQ